MIKKNYQLFFNNDEFYDRIVQTIATAQVEVRVEYYIFELDPVGRRVLDSLGEAVRRGVRVALLVDGVGSLVNLRVLEHECQKRNIEFKVFHPIPRLFKLKIFRSFSLFGRHIARFVRRVNLRNHRKIVYVDGETVFLGSQNITASHSEKYSGAKAWRDTGLCVELAEKNPKDPKPRGDFQMLREAMEETWNLARVYRKPYTARFRPRLQRQGVVFRLNSRIAWRYGHQRELLRRVRDAKNRILITNPYFLPKASIYRALRRAARRGIEVCLCLPEKNDVWFVRLASRSLYYSMLRAGIQIHEYKPRILHAKTMIIDDWALVGSHNLNHRSFFHDLEIETPITDSRNLVLLTDQFKKDISESNKITIHSFGKFSWLTYRMGRIIYWFKHWM